MVVSYNSFYCVKIWKNIEIKLIDLVWDLQ